MIVRTCLLISDDPDHHVDFSEALHAISNDTVLMTVSDVKKAIELLILKKCIPEYVFVNLSMPGIAADEFFSVLNRDATLANISVIAFGENVDAGTLDTSRIALFIEEELGFSELKEELRRVIG